MKLHRPIRLLNTNDLFKLKAKMSRHLSSSSSSSNLPNSLFFNNEEDERRKKKFRGIEVILAPYGISANLLGYISNDSTESQLTYNEWSQFYSLRLTPNLPRVFVVGLQDNAVKLFYPSSFVFLVVGDAETNDENNSGESSDENVEVSESSSARGSSDDSSCKSSDFDDPNHDKENNMFGVQVNYFVE